LQGNTRSIAIRAVAKEYNIDLEIVNTEPAKGVSDDYLKINHLGRIPSFVGQDGYELTECIAIAIYSTAPLHASLRPNYTPPTLHDEKYYQLQLSLSEDYC